MSLDLAEELKARALAAGFDRAGISSLEPLEHGPDFLRWLARGDHAEMDYLASRTEERLDPTKLLPGARSVLCVALQYWPLEEEGEVEGDLWPRVARYARGRDYHNLMGKRLKKLAKNLRSDFPGCETRHYVDTGPVLERELAARAGLGVVGKNTCLLSRQGSWFLLGEIFLTLELPADEPLTDLCGRCTRCLEACPTDALREPYRLDSRKCISYWSIEHRGALPQEVRAGQKDWVFGCDICQEVCPWNIRESPPASHPDLQLPPHRRHLDLIGLLNLDAESYKEAFIGNAMQRARLDGLKRNAANAMGNRGDERYVEPLIRALQEEAEPSVRCHAAWALGQIGGDRAKTALEGQWQQEGNTTLGQEIAQALAALASISTREPVR